MDYENKPTKPSWFVIVEMLISVVLLLVLIYVWSGLSSLLQHVGAPPLVAMVVTTAIMLIGTYFVLRRGK